METQQLIDKLSRVINAETDTLSIWHNQVLDHIDANDDTLSSVRKQQLTMAAKDLARIVDFCRLLSARIDLIAAQELQDYNALTEQLASVDQRPKTIPSCPDCPIRQNPPCESSVPCCRCNEECNSRQPCPKQEQPNQ